MDAYTAALTLLSRRELSTAQLRATLTRRKFAPEDIDDALSRLANARLVDDKRVAVAAARLEATIRQRGRRRAIQRVQQLGVSAAIAKSAVDEAFADIDEDALLDRALQKRLRKLDAGKLDAKSSARIVRALITQGFDAAKVYARLRARGARAIPDAE